MTRRLSGTGQEVKRSSATDQQMTSTDQVWPQALTYHQLSHMLSTMLYQHYFTERFYTWQHVMFRASWLSSKCLSVCPFVRLSHHAALSKRTVQARVIKSLL